MSDPLHASVAAPHERPGGGEGGLVGQYDLEKRKDSRFCRE